MSQLIQASLAIAIHSSLAGILCLLSIPTSSQAEAMPANQDLSQAKCLEAYENAPWEKTLYDFPALALGAGPGWRMLISNNELVEIYITEWDGKCWDINRNPIKSTVKQEIYSDGSPGIEGTGEKYNYRVVQEEDKLVLFETDKESCKVGTVAGNYPTFLNCKVAPDAKFVLGVLRK